MAVTDWDGVRKSYEKEEKKEGRQEGEEGWEEGEGGYPVTPIGPLVHHHCLVVETNAPHL